MKTIHFFIFFMTVSCFSACEILGSKSENSASEDLPLKGTTWWLQSFQDEAGKRSDSKMDDIMLVFTDSDTLQGKAFHKNPTGDVVSSNSYVATFSVDNSSIKINEGITTHVGYPRDSRYKEYLKAKNDAVSYEIQGDRLTIFYGENGKKKLYFKAGKKMDSIE